MNPQDFQPEPKTPLERIKELLQWRLEEHNQSLQYCIKAITSPDTPHLEQLECLHFKCLDQARIEEINLILREIPKWVKGA